MQVKHHQLNNETEEKHSFNYKNGLKHGLTWLKELENQIPSAVH